MPISNSSPHTQMKENTMAARLLLLVILLIFSVTILNWFKLGQFLTVSPPLAPDQQKNEFHRQNGDERLVENIEDSLNSDGQSKEQEGIVIVREEKEEEKGGKEEEGEKGLLDWLHKQQERKASLATACARDSRRELFHFFNRIVSQMINYAEDTMGDCRRVF